MVNSLSNIFTRWVARAVVTDLETIHRDLDKLYGIQVVILNRVKQLGGNVMAGLDDLNAALDAQFEVLVPSLNNVKAELSRLSGLVGTGATEEQLAAAVARVNENANAAAAAVDALVQHPETNTPEVPVDTTPLPDAPQDVVDAPEV